MSTEDPKSWLRPTSLRRKQQFRADANDEPRRASSLRKRPRALRWLVGLGLLVVVNLLLRWSGVRERMVDSGVVVTAAVTLVAVVGAAGVIVGFGPGKWIERDLRRSRRHPLFPTGRLLSRAPGWVQRVFFIGAGTAMMALAAGWALTAW